MNESILRKGIVLAGGQGTRLRPCTLALSKQLIPIYDKPMIYYPLSVLMLAEIREVLIITTPTDLPAFERLFGDGSQLGMKICYAQQRHPDGLAQALTIGADFLDGKPSCLVLGDNLFYGQGFKPILQKLNRCQTLGATVFAYPVKDPHRFGVVEFDPASGKAISLEEKPSQPKSNFAVPGLYFFDHLASEYAAQLQPSPRGELEITDLNRIYLQKGQLTVQPLGRGFAWLDTGTHRNLIDAASFVEIIEERQGLKIACLEEIALDNRWITNDQLQRAAERLGDCNYANYLRNIVLKLREISHIAETIKDRKETR